MKPSATLVCATVAAGLMTIAATAHARVAVPTKGVFAMAFSESTEFGDGYKAGMNAWTAAQAEADIRKHIDDGAAGGIDAFLFDAAGSNREANVWRMARWNVAARAYNAANPTKKICIAPMYEADAAMNGTTEGPLPMFDAADAGGADSPLCTMNSSGQKPVVAVWGNGACVNPLPVISARGPFVMVGTVYNTPENIPTTACVNTWKAAGAAKVYSYYWLSGNGAAVVNFDSKVAEITATGATPIMGIGTAHARSCGDGGFARKSDNFELFDFNYFEVYLRLWQKSIAANLEHVMYTMGGPGDLGEGSYRGSSIVCASRDSATHNAAVGNINHGFTCPAVPSAFRAAMPSGFVRSTSLPLWTHRGLHRSDQVFSKWFKSGEPAADDAFIAFSYRQHVWSLTGLQTCPGAQNILRPSSLGGQFWGDKIAVTSWTPVATRLRIKLAGVTIYDGTLPAKQMKATDSTRQVVVDIGSRRGRPVFEVLNSAGDVVASMEGLLEITDTPLHWGGKTGGNPVTYFDRMGFAAQAGFSGIRIGTTGDVGANVVGGASGTSIEAFGQADDVDIVGNTVSGGKHGIRIGSDGGSEKGLSMAVANNIVVGSTIVGISTSGDIGSDAIYGNNLLYGNTLAMATSVATAAAGTIADDPDFVSASDFRLQASSPARGAGLSAWTTGTDRDGRARKVPPDIGAYEFFDAGAETPCATSVPVGPCEPGGVDYPCSSGPEITSSCPAVPALTAPTSIVVGVNGGAYTLGEAEDALVTCQNLVVQKQITITGGRKVHVRGCEVVLSWDGVTASQSTAALSAAGMDELYIEGSILDANDRCDALALALQAPGQAYVNSETAVTIANSWVGNNNWNKLDGACQGSCVDLQGADQPGKIDLATYNLTCASKAEGLFIPDRQPNEINDVGLRRTNARFGANGTPRSDVYNGGNALYFFSGLAGMDPDVRVSMTDVWGDWNKSDRNVAPGPSTGDAQVVDFGDPLAIRFTVSNLTGEITKGIPPAGDFAPRGYVGRVYSRAAFCSN